MVCHRNSLKFDYKVRKLTLPMYYNTGPGTMGGIDGGGTSEGEGATGTQGRERLKAAYRGKGKSDMTNDR